MKESHPLQLNLTEIIKSRAGRKGKWIPAFLLRGLERVIHQDGLNEILRVAHPHRGSAFSRKVLEHLEIPVEVKGLERLQPRGVQYVFASNHPLGGLDGIALVRVLGEYLGDDNIRVLVNDLLMNVEPLADVFLPTNKFGRKGARQSTRLFNEAMATGKSIVMFPAGLVSRLHPGKEIKDLEWRKTFVTKALEYGCPIVPVRFEALNSMRFYRLAKWRKKLGLKLNLEQVLLPSELIKSRGKNFTIKFFSPMDPASLAASGMKPDEIARLIYDRIYTV